MDKKILLSVIVVLFILLVSVSALLIKNTLNPTGITIADFSSEGQQAGPSTSGELQHEKTLDDTVSESSAVLAIDPKEIIKSIIKLREASRAKNLVNVANFISGLDESFKKINDPTTNMGWQNIVACVYEDCADNRYIELIDDVAILNLEQEKNTIIHSLMETYGLWDGKNLILFSNSLSKTSKLIEDKDDSVINKKWESVVECNGVCADFSERIITLINEINLK